MTVSTTDSGVILTGNNVTLEFPFTFEARTASEVFVSIIDGVVLTPVDPADYTVYLEPSGSSGTVTFLVAPANGVSLYIFRETAQTQLVSVSKQTRYDPTVVADVWDKLTFILQELSGKMDRAVKTAPGEDPAELIDTLVTSAAQAVESAANALASAESAAAKEASMLQGTGQWLTATDYAPSDLAYEAGSQYECIVAHTSGVFATDLSGAKWRLFAQKGAAGAGTGNMLAENNLSDLVDKPTALATIGGQPLDATLSALALLNTTPGLVVQTGTDVFTKRSVEVGRGLQVAFANGATDNPKISAEIQWQAAVTVSSGGTTSLSSSIPNTINEIFVRFKEVELTTGDSARLRIGPSGGLITTGYHGGAWRGSSYDSFSGGMGIVLSGIGRKASGLYHLVKGSSNIWQGTLLGAETVGNAHLGAYSELDVGAVLTQLSVNTTGGSFAGGTWQIGWR